VVVVVIEVVVVTFVALVPFAFVPSSTVVETEVSAAANSPYSSSEGEMPAVHARRCAVG
jgi:hypothetical protein